MFPFDYIKPASKGVVGTVVASESDKAGRTGRTGFSPIPQPQSTQNGVPRAGSFFLISALG